MSLPIVVTGAQLMCTRGTAPGSLTAAPGTVMVNRLPVLNVTSTAPMSNIQPFGMCTSPANPRVAAATAAAQGVLTPQPCVPATSAPWTPGTPTVLVMGKPAIDTSCKCVCAWAGVVSIVVAGQVTTTVP